MMLKHAVQENPGCDGIVLGGHGLFTWGNTQRESYLNTITIIDQLGQFMNRHGDKVGSGLFGGQVQPVRSDRRSIATAILPFLRGRLGAKRRSIASFSDSEDVLGFVQLRQCETTRLPRHQLPDHFIRTKIRPLYIPWAENADSATLKKQIVESLRTYRADYESYYHAHAKPDSPALRDASPTVVLIPGVGMFSFGKNKTEARITAEFYTNAIHVMEGASGLGHGLPPIVTGDDFPRPAPPRRKRILGVYQLCALPPSEAFRIEYWAPRRSQDPPSASEKS